MRKHACCKAGKCVLSLLYAAIYISYYNVFPRPSVNTTATKKSSASSSTSAF